MGRLEKFLAKEEVVDINGESFRVPPLTIKDIPLILGAYKGDQIEPEGMKKLFLHYLKTNFPEETEESLGQFPFQHFNQIIDAVIKVNGLGGDDRIQRIKEKIAARQAEKV